MEYAVQLFCEFWTHPFMILLLSKLLAWCTVNTQSRSEFEFVGLESYMWHSIRA